ncbi:MAG: putative fatty-acid-CoA ligase FadD [Candidatus Binatia bacterium]|nr:MAG: putative fatty-acid-CoA ligase FadD [Candidatus Binatia bacterium]
MSEQTDGLIEAPTFAEGFRLAVSKYGDRPALESADGSVRYTWRELERKVDRLAGGLAALGVKKGDTVALLLDNRPEFHLCDLAAVTLGAVPFSIYQTLPPEQIRYVVDDAAARVAIVEAKYLDRFLEAKRSLPALEHLVVVDGDAPGAIALSELEEKNPAFRGRELLREIRPEDLLTLIYTSGTTGPPKGVQITHRNLMAVVRGLNAIARYPTGGRVISWLPTAHIAERALDYYLPVLLGATITTCPNPREIIEVLPKVRPDYFFAVPRIWEKIKAGLEAQLASLPPEQREKIERALARSLEKVRLEQAKKPVPPELAEEVERADREIFSGIRALLGLDRARIVSVGAAPTPREVVEFFHALGIPLAEGWGMSETCAIGTVNPPGRIKIGTVGLPVPGVEIRIADDGEILVRGENVMAGYRNLPEKTAETLLPGGWLATGDVGEIDEDGYLRIVDRKKEIIINAAGKNMSPANIESTVKAASPLVGQVCVIGDRRPYNTALVVLDPDAARQWAREHGRGEKSLEELATDEELRAELARAIERANAKLARVEQIKKFTIVPGDWLPGGDELTPTMKLKRKAIAEKYADLIERMYAPAEGNA